jgi:3D (Asp-Asp-Asp) domain-containing protein
MKSIFCGGAIIATALLAGFLMFFASPLAAETVVSKTQKQPKQLVAPNQGEAQELSGSGYAEGVAGTESSGKIVGYVTEAPAASIPASAALAYVATAYSLRGRTASGKFVSNGIIAADPRILPLGSRVRLEAGRYSGEYLVADTGGAIRGRKIDIWTSSSREAMRFGRRTVKLTVLSYGGKRSAQKKRA